MFRNNRITDPDQRANKFKILRIRIRNSGSHRTTYQQKVNVHVQFGRAAKEKVSDGCAGSLQQSQAGVDVYLLKNEIIIHTEVLT